MNLCKNEVYSFFLLLAVMYVGKKWLKLKVMWKQYNGISWKITINFNCIHNGYSEILQNKIPFALYKSSNQFQIFSY